MCFIYQTGGHTDINRRLFPPPGASNAEFALVCILETHQSCEFFLTHTTCSQVSAAGGLRCPSWAVLPAGEQLLLCSHHPCRYHILCFVPKGGTQPYVVLIWIGQTRGSEDPLTQTFRSLATLFKCLWILSGLPWARNLVWKGFSLQNFGSSASGAI